MAKAGANDWKTPLGYYERAIAELSKAREEFQAELQTVRELQSSHATLKADLKAAQTELQNLRELQSSHDTLQAELQATQADLQALREHQSSHTILQEEIQATKAKFETAFQDTHTELQTLKENLYQSFQSIFVKAPQWQNATNHANWQTVITYQLNLSTQSYINLFGYGHGYASNESPLDVAIFINGEQMDEYWGVGLTHSHYWQPLLTIAYKNQSSGNHTIELKFCSRCGNSKHWVNFNGACMLMMTTSNIN